MKKYLLLAIILIFYFSALKYVEYKNIDTAKTVTGIKADILKYKETVSVIGKVDIINPDKILINCPVSEEEIEKIEIGQEAKIIFSAIKNMEYIGEVIKIENYARAESAISGKTVVDVTIYIDFDEKIKKGYTSKIEIILSENENIIIPYEAINQDEQNRSYVYKAYDNIAYKQYIREGRETEEGIEVVFGIKEGEIILTSHNLYKDKERVILDCVDVHPHNLDTGVN